MTVNSLQDKTGGETKVLNKYVVIGRPRVEVAIYQDPEGRRYYDISEPRLNTEIRRASYLELSSMVAHDAELLEKMSSLGTVESVFELLLPYARQLIRRHVGRNLRLLLSPGRITQAVEEAAVAVAYHVARDYVGYGPLEPLMRDPYIEDISCNGLGIPVFVYHTNYEWLTTSITFTNLYELRSLVMKLGIRINKEPSIATPIVEGILKPEGYRVNIVLDEVSRLGPQFTIRKFRAEPITVLELLRKRTLDPFVTALLWQALDFKQGVVIYGVTGSGKTTLLNAITMLLPPEYKITTVEDTPEIFLPFHENWAAMTTRLSTDPQIQNVTMQAQVEAALRQRPDVIIVGEIRSREAYTFFQALATGHGGVTTIHAESAEALISRLASPPMEVPKSLIATAKLFVNIQRVEQGGNVVRKVIRVHETTGYDLNTDSIKLQEVVVWNPETDQWRLRTKELSTLKVISNLSLRRYDEVFDDLIMRATVLDWLARESTNVTTLYSITRAYRRSPAEVYEKAERAVGRYRVLLEEGGEALGGA